MANGLVYLGLGAAIMYLMDPQAGRRRRADLKNQMDSTVRDVNGTLNSWNRDNWSPAQRALAGACGSSLATYGYFRGGLKGFLLCTLGGGLLARATANENIASLGKGKGIDLEKTLRIDAPDSAAQRRIGANGASDTSTSLI